MHIGERIFTSGFFLFVVAVILANADKRPVDEMPNVIVVIIEIMALFGFIGIILGSIVTIWS